MAIDFRQKYSPTPRSLPGGQQYKFNQRPREESSGGLLGKLLPLLAMGLGPMALGAIGPWVGTGLTKIGGLLPEYGQHVLGALMGQGDKLLSKLPGWCTKGAQGAAGTTMGSMAAKGLRGTPLDKPGSIRGFGIGNESMPTPVYPERRPSTVPPEDDWGRPSTVPPERMQPVTPPSPWETPRPGTAAPPGRSIDPGFYMPDPWEGINRDPGFDMPTRLDPWGGVNRDPGFHNVPWDNDVILDILRKQGNF